MAIEETLAHGAAVKIGDAASPEVFNAIEGVFNGPVGGGWTPRMAEALHHSRTTVLKRATVLDTGDVTFSIYYDSSDVYHAQLRDAAKNKTLTNFQVVFTDAGDEQYAFGAYVAFNVEDTDPEGWNVRNISLSIYSDITVT